MRYIKPKKQYLPYESPQVNFCIALNMVNSVQIYELY